MSRLRQINGNGALRGMKVLFEMGLILVAVVLAYAAVKEKTNTNTKDIARNNNTIKANSEEIKEIREFTQVKITKIQGDINNINNKFGFVQSGINDIKQELREKRDAIP